MRRGRRCQRHEYYCGNPAENLPIRSRNSRSPISLAAVVIGKAIEPLLRYVDFSTVVLDDRPEFANKERFPRADRVLVINSYEESFRDIETDENSYIIIVTRGHRGDYAVLENAIRQTAYIGMIGSKKKVLEMFERLRASGVADEVINRILFSDRFEHPCRNTGRNCSQRCCGNDHGQGGTWKIILRLLFWQAACPVEWAF